MSPLVEESWEEISDWSFSSGSIFLANCFPNSTLRRRRDGGGARQGAVGGGIAGEEREEGHEGE